MYETLLLLALARVRWRWKVGLHFVVDWFDRLQVANKKTGIHWNYGSGLEENHQCAVYVQIISPGARSSLPNISLSNPNGWFSAESC